jgi:pilus assembly protein CpaE
VATNLACALKAESEIKVALWDTSFQFGDIGVMLNMQASRTIVDILPQIEGLDADVLNGVMQSHASGVRVLLAPPEPQFADSIRTSHLEKILAELRQLYDFVVIDTWSSLYDQMLFILDAADRIVLLVTPEVPAIKNTKLFFDITDRLGYPPDKIMLVLNKWDRRSGIRPEKVHGVLNHRLDGLIPLDDRIVPLSVNQGTPFVISYKTAPISQSVFELSKHLLEALRPQPETAASAEEADGRSARRLGGLFR